MSSPSDKALDLLFSPLTLPGGQVLPNRLAKAALEENMGRRGQLPSRGLLRNYEEWSDGGTGLLLTGNVMVTGDAITSPAGIVLTKDTPQAPFRRWAEVGSRGGNQIWMQINHPGRQVRSDLGVTVWGPSDITLDPESGMWGKPRPLTLAKIEQVIQRFVDTAQAAVRAGFGGVEIHASHGYLINQFLSPLANTRSDQYGGSIGNRMRLLLEVVDAVRSAIPASAAIGVKLNTTDFLRGGFDEEDAKKVVRALSDRRVDLIELTGGSVEKPVMHGAGMSSSTQKREAYFLDKVPQLLAASEVPIMLTGGIWTRRTALDVLATGVAVVGMATALAICPDLPKRWKKGEYEVSIPDAIGSLEHRRAAAAKQAWIRYALHRRGASESRPLPDLGQEATLVRDTRRRLRLISRYQRFVAENPGVKL